MPEMMRATTSRSWQGANLVRAQPAQPLGCIAVHQTQASSCQTLVLWICIKCLYFCKTSAAQAEFKTQDDTHTTET